MQFTRNGRSKSFRILHQHLPELFAPDVGRANKNDGSLVIGTRVIKAHFLVCQDLVAFV